MERECEWGVWRGVWGDGLPVVEGGRKEWWLVEVGDWRVDWGVVAELGEERLEVQEGVWELGGGMGVGEGGCEWCRVGMV